VLLTIDLTPDVAAEAIEAKAGAVIAYHPPIFAALKRLVARSPQGSVVPRMIESGIAIYSPHTALDNAPGMLTDWLIDQCGAVGERAALVPAPAADAMCKVVVFVPVVPGDVIERVRAAMASSGAGVIGNYESCSFASAGRGSFRGNEASRPAVGRAGELESVEELRLEMVCPAAMVEAVIAAVRSVHPYEEPAFDVYPLAGRTERRAGGGRVAMLNSPTALADITGRLKQRLGIAAVQVAEARSTVSRIACVPGSGAALVSAAIAAGADCFVTGEMKHHEVLAALDGGCSVILAGHTETERPYLKVLCERLVSMGLGARFMVSARDRAPLRGA
jgi:dinuclear metal center YbgI/SA1388 family protein